MSTGGSKRVVRLDELTPEQARLVRALVDAGRAAQGLPEYVEHGPTLERVARLFAEGRKR